MLSLGLLQTDSVEKNDENIAAEDEEEGAHSIEHSLEYPLSSSSDQEKTASFPAVSSKRFNEWLHSICLVTFDNEVGQKIEKVYPSCARLDAVEWANIAYMAFPDSNSHSSGRNEAQYYFRLKRTVFTNGCSNKGNTATAVSSTKLALEMPAPCREEPGSLYGFVHFYQKRDEFQPRGYTQQSVVLLTERPLVGLFLHSVRLIAESYFAHGEPAIDTVYQHISHWPRLRPGALLELPLLGVVLQCRIPSRNDIPQRQLTLNLGKQQQPLQLRSHSSVMNRLGAKSGATAPFSSLFPFHHNKNAHQQHSHSSQNGNGVFLEAQNNGSGGDSFAHQPPFSRRVSATIETRAFFESVQQLVLNAHLLWELILLGEPLMVVADTPATCSQLVHSLTSLIWPLRCAMDTRPFFTIHDPDFNEIIACSGNSSKPPSMILGVTNPFFLKVLAHWPHILKVCTATNSTGLSPIHHHQKAQTFPKTGGTAMKASKSTDKLQFRGPGHGGVLSDGGPVDFLIHQFQLLHQKKLKPFGSSSCGLSGGSFCRARNNTESINRRCSNSESSSPSKLKVPDENLSKIRSAMSLALDDGKVNSTFAAASGHQHQTPAVLEAMHFCNGNTAAGKEHRKLIKVRRSSDRRSLENKAQGLFTDYRPFLAQEKSLLQKLLSNCSSNGEVDYKCPQQQGGVVLRRHFLDLTQSFLLPLERYFDSLMPRAEDVSPFRAIPQCRQFVPSEFFVSLGSCKSSNCTPVVFGVRGNWIGLYRRFVANSPIFRDWLRQKIEEANAELAEAHTNALCSVSINTAYFNGRCQVEIIDFVLRVQTALKKCRFEQSSCCSDEDEGGDDGSDKKRSAPAPESDRRKWREQALCSQLRLVMDSVDEDLRRVLRSNRALMQDLDILD